MRSRIQASYELSPDNARWVCIAFRFITMTGFITTSWPLHAWEYIEHFTNAWTIFSPMHDACQPSISMHTGIFLDHAALRLLLCLHHAWNSILVCGGGGVALHTTRKLKNMGSWVWQLQRTDVRRSEIEKMMAFVAKGDALNKADVQKAFDSERILDYHLWCFVLSLLHHAVSEILLPSYRRCPSVYRPCLCYPSISKFYICRIVLIVFISHPYLRYWGGRCCYLNHWRICCRSQSWLRGMTD